MDWFKDFWVPIISAMIGGGLTLLGVIITIHAQNKKDKDDKKNSLKPYFYICHPLQVATEIQKATEYNIVPLDNEDTEYKVQGIIQNTDNAIFILKSVRIGSQYYYPESGKVIDKRELFYLNIYSKQISEDICLTITDVMENEYTYIAVCSKTRENYYQIDSFKEIV